jgi:hypothetical protein
LKKRSYDDMDEDAWRRGSGSIEEKVEIDHVSCTKPKKVKLCTTSSSPIKTTQLEQDSNANGNHFKQSSDSPLLKSNGVTAVMAVLFIPTGDHPGTKTKTSKYRSKTRRQNLVAKRSINQGL